MRQHLALLLVVGCGAEPPGGLGPDCQALVAAAERTAACDPALSPLARRLQRSPDEAQCRRAARRVLAQAPSQRPGVRSLYDAQASADSVPLHRREKEALEKLPRAARLVLSPDLEPAPGSAPTAASLDGLSLEADPDGRLQTYVAPGLRTLEVRHAGRSTSYCVDLRPCETLAVTLHGAKLARDPSVRTGPC